MKVLKKRTPGTQPQRQFQGNIMQVLLGSSFCVHTRGPLFRNKEAFSVDEITHFSISLDFLTISISMH